MNKSLITIILFAIVGGLLSATLSFLRPLEYSSRVRLLVIQRGNVPGDAYNAIKSTEGISESLSEIMTTSSFLQKVLAQDTVDRRTFRGDDRQKRKKWLKTIQPSVVRGTGFIDVVAYHTDPSQATEITKAVSGILISEGWQFVSTPIEVKMVDAPLESRFPVRPNFFTNAFVGLLLGAAVGYLYLLKRKI